MRRFALALVMSIVPTSWCLAQNCTSWERQRLRAPDEILDNRFGHSVAVRGDLAVVSAYLDDDHGTHSGSVYVYRMRDGEWEFQQKLLGPGTAPFDEFGFSVATDGTVIAVGATGFDDVSAESGAVFLFRWDGAQFAFEQRVTAPDQARRDQLGYSIAVSGDAVVAGAIFDQDAGPETGSAYVFRHDGSRWAFEQKLTASNAAAFDLFGFSVALDGDRALVGAAQDTGDGPGKASAFRFDGSAWIEDQQLVPSDTALGDQFGWATSMRGDLALIGAPGKSNDRGAAYLFRWTGSAWSEEQIFVAPDGALFDQFGVATSIDPQSAVVSAFGEDVPGVQSGAAYLLQWDGSRFAHTRKLEPSDAASFSLFGAAVAHDGPMALIGNEIALTDASTAYAFELRDLGLHATPSEPRPFSTVTFVACSGEVAGPALLAVVDVAGAATFLGIAAGTFDSNGSFQWSARVPIGLSGIDITAQAFGLTSSGRIESSNEFVVAFQ